MALADAADAAARRDFAQPQWRGEAAAGRTLLIHAEQGFGDTLQFCRYAPLAAARGLRVIMEVQQPLVRLLRGLPGVDRVVARGEDAAAVRSALPDAQHAAGAGHHAGDHSGRACPICTPMRRRSAAWRTRLAAAVGRRASGRPGLGGQSAAASAAPAAVDRRRSMAPDRLAPLLAVPGLQFFSLQKDGPAAPADFRLTDFMDEMDDFADTAALIANLDLVISVDTAVAHLAAALGKPVWLLDRFDPAGAG